MTEKDLNQDISKEEKCSVYGLTILQKPEWKDVSFNPNSNYKITTTIIGKNLLSIKSYGFASLEDMTNGIEFTEKIVSDYFGKGMKYVRMEDLSEFKGVSNDARAFYASSMSRNEPLLGLIYYNVSPLLKWSVQLGIKFGMVPFSVQMANSFPDAIKRAQRLTK